ncbi:DUF2971 domain-containing protein [Asticcacaulis endophyticus]|uniref:DUF2971 domain-containing protein n=1 Tax=Asticcacaulis endophyticus TaxID=1395890 RepID=A0A918QAM6_9CAUL|nr:DUF2971 domain-containing protein [Asticcacaulis endophyticus]GGZ39952.1 hypothetical protein GCM10011273_28270 [Asticcacaulis endophyticus]
MKKKPLLRYTDLTSLFYILHNKKITLLNPDLWDDRNDIYFIDLYKKRRNFESVLVMCLSDSTLQTYNQWSVFSKGSGGVCISFDREKLLNHFSKEEFIHKKVSYKSVRNLKEYLKSNIDYVDDLPFIKRNSYSAEMEYRIIKGFSEKVKYADVSIELSCINRITLSPWMPIPLAKNVKDTIKLIEGVSKIPVFRSTILENSDWKWTGEFADVLDLIE